MTRRVKWYQKKLFFLACGVIILYIILYAATKSTIYFNYQELLKSENESLKIQIDSLKEMYDKIEKRKEKVKIIREKISTKDQDTKIAKLQEELKKLKSRQDTTFKKDSPEDLYKYFKNFK